jgi:hypothetical protein
MSDIRSGYEVYKVDNAKPFFLVPSISREDVVEITDFEPRQVDSIGS